MREAIALCNGLFSPIRGIVLGAMQLDVVLWVTSIRVGEREEDMGVSEDEKHRLRPNRIKTTVLENCGQKWEGI